MNIFIEKLVDLLIDPVIKFFIYILKVISPIKISPKEICGQNDQGQWENILDIEIENRLNTNLYNVHIAGISKETFSVKIISENPVKRGKTVEFMDINTDRLIVRAIDKQTNNHLWIFRIHKLNSKEVLNLRLKIKNKKTIYFKTLGYSSVEVPIRERGDGAVEIPFKVDKVPKIK